MVVVMQRIYPENIIDVFGVFDNRELAEAEVKKAVKAVYADNPEANHLKIFDTCTVYFDYSKKTCIQFNFSEIEKNKQLLRCYKGNINTLKANGWETTKDKVFMWN